MNMIWDGGGGGGERFMGKTFDRGITWEFVCMNISSILYKSNNFFFASIPPILCFHWSRMEEVGDEEEDSEEDMNIMLLRA